jgi:Mor family transcriptional regulator
MTSTWNMNNKEYEELLIKTEKPKHREIYFDYIHGMTVEELSQKYRLTIPAIHMTITKQKHLNEFKNGERGS